MPKYHIEVVANVTPLRHRSSSTYQALTDRKGSTDQGPQFDFPHFPQIQQDTHIKTSNDQASQSSKQAGELCRFSCKPIEDCVLKPLASFRHTAVPQVHVKHMGNSSCHHPANEPDFADFPEHSLFGGPTTMVSRTTQCTSVRTFAEPLMSNNHSYQDWSTDECAILIREAFLPSSDKQHTNPKDHVEMDNIEQTNLTVKACPQKVDEQIISNSELSINVSSLSLPNHSSFSQSNLKRNKNCTSIYPKFISRLEGDIKEDDLESLSSSMSSDITKARLEQRTKSRKHKLKRPLYEYRGTRLEGRKHKRRHARHLPRNNVQETSKLIKVQEYTKNFPEQISTTILSPTTYQNVENENNTRVSITGDESEDTHVESYSFEMSSTTSKELPLRDEIKENSQKQSTEHTKCFTDMVTQTDYTNDVKPSTEHSQLIQPSVVVPKLTVKHEPPDLLSSLVSLPQRLEQNCGLYTNQQRNNNIRVDHNEFEQLAPRPPLTITNRGPWTSRNKFTLRSVSSSRLPIPTTVSYSSLYRPLKIPLSGSSKRVQLEQIEKLNEDVPTEVPNVANHNDESCEAVQQTQDEEVQCNCELPRSPELIEDNESVESVDRIPTSIGSKPFAVQLLCDPPCTLVLSQQYSGKNTPDLTSVRKNDRNSMPSNFSNTNSSIDLLRTRSVSLPRSTDDSKDNFKHKPDKIEQSKGKSCPRMRPPSQLTLFNPHSNESVFPARLYAYRGQTKSCVKHLIHRKFYIRECKNVDVILTDPNDRRIKAICDRYECNLEIYSKLPWCGFMQYVVILTAQNSAALLKCARTLDSRLNWCLLAQLR